MELNDLDKFYLNSDEPIRGCLYALRDIILKMDPKIQATWKFGGPFFCYDNKILCYLWIDRKRKQPYLAMYKGNQINHPLLEAEGRAMIKVMRFRPEEDLPIDQIQEVLNLGLNIYKENNTNGKK